MARRSRATVKGKAHRFGGDWTSDEAGRAREVPRGVHHGAEGQALAGAPFRKAYIDAFAGTGYRTMRRERDEDAPSGSLLFPDLAELRRRAARRLGAARAEGRASFRPLHLHRAQTPNAAGQLEGLKTEFPDARRRTSDVKQGEANAEIQKLCAKRLDVAPAPCSFSTRTACRSSGRRSKRSRHEGHRPVAALSARHRREPSAHEVGRDSRARGAASRPLPRHARTGTTSSTRSRPSPRSSATTRTTS